MLLSSPPCCPPVPETRNTLKPGNCHRREWQIFDSLIFSKTPLTLCRKTGGPVAMQICWPTARQRLLSNQGFRSNHRAAGTSKQHWRSHLQGRASPMPCNMKASYKLFILLSLLNSRGLGLFNATHILQSSNLSSLETGAVGHIDRAES